MIDYHLHLWPHSTSSVWFDLDQIADVLRRGGDPRRHRARPDRAREPLRGRHVGGRSVLAALRPRADQPDAWPSTSTSTPATRSTTTSRSPSARRTRGCPSRSASRSTTTAARWTRSSALLAQYPFDVLIGSVHWLGTWQFDDIDNEVQMHEWAVRDVDQCWADYAEALEELARRTRSTCWPTPTSSRSPASIACAIPSEYWDRMAEAAARGGRVDRVLVRGVGQAGRRAVSRRRASSTASSRRASPSRRRATRTASSAWASAAERPRGPARGARGHRAGVLHQARASDRADAGALVATLAELASLRTGSTSRRSTTCCASRRHGRCWRTFVLGHAAHGAQVDEPPTAATSEFVVLGQMRPNNRSTLLERGPRRHHPDAATRGPSSRARATRAAPASSAR